MSENDFMPLSREVLADIERGRRAKLRLEKVEWPKGTVIQLRVLMRSDGDAWVTSPSRGTIRMSELHQVVEVLSREEKKVRFDAFVEREFPATDGAKVANARR